MKLKLLLLAFFFTFIVSAQIPSGYYSSATGTGYTLKTQLYNIIKGHQDNAYAGLYTTYQTSDRDYFYENDGTVLDMYSENPTGADPYNFTSDSAQRCGNYSVEGDCYNREHIIPQSIFGSQSPMVADAHFITPTDGKVNGMRSNFPHGNVAVASYISKNGSKLGTSAVAGYTGTVFEPIDEFKGDIARMYFYFATRYENVITSWGVTYGMFNGTSDQVFTPEFLIMLRAWNALDPVSDREIARNNAIYGTQNNRNPYIDHPEYVEAVWNPTPDSEAPTAATNLMITGFTDTTISLSWSAGTDNVAVTSYDIYVNGIKKTAAPGTTATITGLTPSTDYSCYVIAKDAATNASPASNTVNGTTGVFVPDTEAPSAPSNLVVTGSSSNTLSLSWNLSTDNKAVTSYEIYMDTVLKTTVSGTTSLINGLTPTTSYSFYVIAKDASANSSTQSNMAIGTTTEIVSNANELFFSEYIEGSSNNKAIEITNNTSNPIDMSVYSLKRQLNGTGAWATALNLTGTIYESSVYVIVNSSIALTCYNKTIANISTAADAMVFNGNDPVGLFKNNVLIDIIGVFNGGEADFAKDVTLRRKASITTPNITFDKNLEWDSFGIDTCDGLGSITLGLNSKLNNEKILYKIYPNPSNGNFNILFNDVNSTHIVEIFSLTGQKVFEKTQPQSGSLSVTNLTKGTYLIKVSEGSKITTKKIVIN